MTWGTRSLCTNLNTKRSKNAQNWKNSRWRFIYLNFWVIFQKFLKILEGNREYRAESGDGSTRTRKTLQLVYTSRYVVSHIHTHWQKPKKHLPPFFDGEAQLPPHHQIAVTVAAALPLLGGNLFTRSSIAVGDFFSPQPPTELCFCGVFDAVPRWHSGGGERRVKRLGERENGTVVCGIEIPSDLFPLCTFYQLTDCQ